jgi:hypothetical protein
MSGGLRYLLLVAALACSAHSSAETNHNSCVPAVASDQRSSAQFSILNSQFIKRTDPWLTSENAAGLTRYAHANMAEAELSLTKAKGGFTNFDGSPDVWQADAHIESFFRLSSRAVCFGSMSYQSFDGTDMAGSAFIPAWNSQLSARPNGTLSSERIFNSQLSRRPFDLVEDSLMNTGDKHLDVYHLTGGIGFSLGSATAATSPSLGLRFDYTAANYAKYKDLRHQNKLMDLQLTAGLYWPFASWGALGADYRYHRNTESITFGTYGKNEKVYQTLISYAAFTGHLEQFGSTGYTDKSREMPLVTDENGLGLQFSIFNSQFSIFSAFSYAHANGYYGRKSPYTITYTGHESDIYHFNSQLTAMVSHDSRLSLDFSLDIENLQNEANTYRELQNESGATYYNYYTPVKTANKLWTDWSLSATADLGIRDSMPTWTLQAGFIHGNRRQTAYLYPYYRHQELSRYTLFASVERNLVTRQGVWSFSANASFAKGEGDPYDDRTFQAPSDKQSAPPSMDAYLYREYDYLTAPQYGLGGAVKYTFLFPGTQLQTHARLSLQHQKANNVSEYSAGCDRTTATIAIGCTF